MGGMRLMETNSELLEMFWLVVKVEEEEKLIYFAWNDYFGDNGCSRCWLGDEYDGIVKMDGNENVQLQKWLQVPDSYNMMEL